MQTLLDRCAYCLLMMVMCLERGFMQKACTNQVHLTRYPSYAANKVLSGDFQVLQGVNSVGQVCLLIIDDGQVP